VALAIASARSDSPVVADTLVVGERGHGGEVRHVPHIGRRLVEAQRLGFTRAIVPVSTPDVPGIRLVRVGDLAAAMSVPGVAAGNNTP
ncbi:MAG: DNA repair protein RadA, partial [Acidimicrobiia bacterium]